MARPQGGTARGFVPPGGRCSLAAPAPEPPAPSSPPRGAAAGSGRELRPRRGGDPVPGSRSINKPASKLRGAALASSCRADVSASTSFHSGRERAGAAPRPVRAGGVENANLSSWKCLAGVFPPPQARGDAGERWCSTAPSSSSALGGSLRRGTASCPPALGTARARPEELPLFSFSPSTLGGKA